MAAAAPLAAMGPATVLVTGATGFVGRHVLRALGESLPSARLVIGTQRMPGLATADSVHLDLLDAGSLDAAVVVVRPDAVLHLAAQSAIPASFADPGLTWRANLLGTLALAEAVLRHAPAALFVFASSAEVYGLSFRGGQPLDETAALAPANPYAASKAAADLGLGEMALRGLHAIRIRPFNQIGPGQSAAFVVAAFARQVARIEAGLQEPVIRTGMLDRWRDLMDVRDAGAGYAAALRHGPGLPAGTVLNLASGRSRRIGDILVELMDRAGLRVPVEQDPGRLRPNDVERAAGDAGRARAMLGWAPAIPWDRTMADILEDWRQRVRMMGAAA